MILRVLLAWTVALVTGFAAGCGRGSGPAEIPTTAAAIQKTDIGGMSGFDLPGKKKSDKK